MSNEKTINKKDLSIKRRIIEISNKLKVEAKGENTFLKHKYITPGDITKSLNPLLQEYNLISIFNMDQHGKEFFIGKLVIEDCDKDDKIRYRFIIPFNEVKGSSAAQAMGATLTYCKRYSLMNAFNIAGDDDLDKVVDGKNVKETKQNTNTTTVVEIIKKINLSETKEKIEEWKGWLKLSTGYTDPQKNVMERAIEEQEKKI